MYKVHLARLVSQDHQAPILDLQVDSCLSFTVSQTENHSVRKGCQNYGLAIVCCTWKGKRKLIIKILVCIVVHNCSLVKIEHGVIYAVKGKSNGVHYRIINYLFSTELKLIYTDYKELGYAALLRDPFKWVSAVMQLNKKIIIFLPLSNLD